MAKGKKGQNNLQRLAEMANGFQQTCVLMTAVQLGLLEELDKEPASCQRLAANLDLHPGALERLLRALLSLDLLTYTAGLWGLSDTARLLKKDGFAASLRAWLELTGGEYYRAWGALEHSVRTGEPSFPKLFGVTAWEHRAQNPPMNEAFLRLSQGEQRVMARHLHLTYPIPAQSTVLDIGGGQGNLLLELLRAREDLSGLLLELPQAAEAAEAAFSDAGLTERCRVIRGSFFEELPQGTGVLILKAVLHNWDDEDCQRLLTNCARSMGPNSRLLVVERILPEQEEELLPEQAMLDLHMLTVLGGRERTLEDYRALFESCGLTLLQTLPARPPILPPVMEVALADSGEKC